MAKVAAGDGGRWGVHVELVADGGWEIEAVARRFGVAPATLRSWQRRYGIGPAGHTRGARRVYRPADVARLQLMHRALARGMSAADAAAWALAQPDPPTTGAEPTPAAWPVADTDPDPDPNPNPDPDPDPEGQRGRHGGRSLALPGASAAARGLARAVLWLDPAAVRVVLAEAIATRGIVSTWDDLARPVLGAIARQWHTSGAGVEREHLLSECLVREFDHAAVTAHRRHPPRNPRPVLLACAPEEQHSLPLSALNAALAEQHVSAHLLGARLPGQALADAVARLAPIAVLLWAQAPPRPALLHSLPAPHPTATWFVGGPGWRARTTPDGAAVLTSLAEATQILTRTALGG